MNLDTLGGLYPSKYMEGITKGKGLFMVSTIIIVFIVLRHRTHSRLQEHRNIMFDYIGTCQPVAYLIE